MKNRIKKFLAIVISITLICTGITIIRNIFPKLDNSIIANAAIPVTEAFDDIKGDEWYTTAIQFVYDRGIMTGKGDSFDPNSSITREEFVQVLYNLAGKPAVSGRNPFINVTEDKWYFNSVLWAKKEGIVSGYGNGKFGVGDKITREQLAQMLFKYAKVCLDDDLIITSNEANGFRDSDNISVWAKEAMDWAVTQGIMAGKGKSGSPKSELSLDPLGYATRAECAQMIKNFCTKYNL